MQSVFSKLQWGRKKFYSQYAANIYRNAVPRTHSQTFRFSTSQIYHNHIFAKSNPYLLTSKLVTFKNSSSSDRSYTSTNDSSTIGEKGDTKEGRRNRSIILDKERWEKVFTENHNDNLHNESVSDEQSELKTIPNGESPGSESPSNIDCLIKEGKMFLQSKDNWKNEDVDSVISVLRKLTHKLHEEMEHDISQINSNIDADKYPWIKQQNIRNARLQNSSKVKHQETLLTSVQLLHQLISWPSLTHSMNSEILHMIPIIVHVWSKVAKTNKKWALTKDQNPQKAAETLQDLGNTLKYLLQVNHFHSHNLEKDHAKNDMIGHNTISVSWKEIPDLKNIKDQNQAFHFDANQHYLRSTYESIINAWCDSSYAAPKHTFDSVQNATAILNELEENLSISPSISMYRKVVNTWSYLLQRSLHSHRFEAKTKIVNPNNNKYSNEKTKQDKNTNNQPFPPFYAAEQIHDILNQSTKHCQLNIEIYNALLSIWENITLILTKHRKNGDDMDYDYYARKAAEMAQKLLDQMDALDKSDFGSNHTQFSIPTPNAASYKAVLAAWTNIGDDSSAEKILQRMEKNVKCQPDISCFKMVIKSHTESITLPASDLPQRLEDILSRAELNATQILSKTDANHMLNDDTRKADFSNIKPNEVFYTTVIQSWVRFPCQSENDAIYAAERAEAVLVRMKRLHSANVTLAPPSVYCYGGVISAWAKSKSIGHERSIEIFNDMISSYLQHNNPKDGYEREAATLALNMLIGLWAKQGKRHARAAETIDELLIRMNELQASNWVVPDIVTVSSIMKAWETTGEGDIQIAEQVEDLLREIQTKFEMSGNPKQKPHILTLNATLKAWIQTSIKQPDMISIACKRADGLLQWAETLYQTDVNDSMRPGVRQYNMLIGMISKNNEDSRALTRISELMLQMNELQIQEDQNESKQTKRAKKKLGRNTIRADAYTYYLVIESLINNKYMTNIEKAQYAKEYLLQMMNHQREEILEKKEGRKPMSISTMISCFQLAVDNCINVIDWRCEEIPEVLNILGNITGEFYKATGSENPLKLSNTRVYESLIRAYFKILPDGIERDNAIENILNECNANGRLTEAFLKTVIDEHADIKHMTFVKSKLLEMEMETKENNQG